MMSVIKPFIIMVVAFLFLVVIPARRYKKKYFCKNCRVYNKIGTATYCRKCGEKL